VALSCKPSPPRRLLDMVELGVDRFRALRDFKAAAATVQVGNKVRPAGIAQSYVQQC